MTRSYRAGVPRWWQALSDRQIALIVGHIVVGVWLHRPVPVIGLFAVSAAVCRARAVVLLCVVGGLAGMTLSNQTWRGVAPDNLGPYQGWTCLVTDPTPQNGAMAVILEIEGERFQTWARGSSRRRISTHLAGECVQISGSRRALDGVNGRRAAIRHVVGRFDIDTIGDWGEGTALDRASNRVRRLFGVGASELGPPDDALFAGLVIGDDRNEPVEMIQQFRGSGLSHLTAVSGQNVGFVLAAASPLLRRLRPWARWLCTLGLIGWFVALTRFEPSVLRAGVMGCIAATGFVLGRERPPTRVLALAVGLLVLIDPLLVWSVGFWLSVGATAGVALLGTPLAEFIPGPKWLAVPAAVTLGAQAGVAPVSLLVFGTLPVVSVPANLLAVPIAGLVMLYGLPAGLLAGACGGLIASVVQIPSALGTRWVATVAALGSRLEPPAPFAAIGWAVLVLVIAARFVSARRRRVCEGDGNGAALHHGRRRITGPHSGHRARPPPCR